MPFPKLVFPINSTLKSQWDTDINSAIFDGNSLSIPVQPGELSYEYEPSEISIGVSSYYQSYPQSNDPIRMILSLNEGREAIYYILRKLKEDSLDNRETVACLDYYLPDLADIGTGYSTRQLLFSTLTIEGGVIIDDMGNRYLSQIQADFTIFRS